MLPKINDTLPDIGLTIEGMFRFLPDLEHWLARMEESFGHVNGQRHSLPILW